MDQTRTEKRHEHTPVQDPDFKARRTVLGAVVAPLLMMGEDILRHHRSLQRRRDQHGACATKGAILQLVGCSVVRRLPGKRRFNLTGDGVQGEDAAACLHGQLSPSSHVAWVVPVPGRGQPAVLESSVFYMTSNRDVLSVSRDGHIQWRSSLGPGQAAASGAILGTSGTVLVVGDYDGHAFRLLRP